MDVELLAGLVVSLSRGLGDRANEIRKMRLICKSL